MDQVLRNRLRTVVTQCRRLLENAVAEVLQGQFGVYATGKKDEVVIEDAARMTHLTNPDDLAFREQILVHLAHIQATGFKAQGKPTAPALQQLVREVAFTHLNRLCAYKMMEMRGLIREAVSRGVKSQGFLYYLSLDGHEAEAKLYESGQQELAYRLYLRWLGGTLSEEIGVLFSPNDAANRLFPPHRVLEEVLDLINGEELKGIWTEDEAIGWVYQYFTPKELRDQARKESASPRNSYELAFRNQFFTPRYVVEFLTDNTLGRIWYEMRKGDTVLKARCRYLVRRPDEVFLAPSTSDGHQNHIASCGAFAALLREGDEKNFTQFSASDQDAVRRMIDLAHCVSAYDRLGDQWGRWFEEVGERLRRGELAGFSTQELLDYLFLTCRSDRHGGDGEVYRESWFIVTANEVRRRFLAARRDTATQEQLLRSPVLVSFRAKKDPRELKILDPACGSGHFLLYCFDVLLLIYEEAYADPDLGPALQKEYETLEAFRRAIPALILKHNLHGIDIDLRASQIATLALWLRAQRAYQDMEIKKDRPKITRSNIVCAEPMPGEDDMLTEFVADLQPTVLGQLVRVVFDRMKLAGEAGSLLKIEAEIQSTVEMARGQWLAEREQATDRKGNPLLFTRAEMNRLSNRPQTGDLFDVLEITEEQFWHDAEERVVEALQAYARRATNGKGLHRQLFAEDAARGFAFVDVCRQRFDVALMNPPFGEGSKPSKEYVEKTYSRTKNDVYAAFVERALGMLATGGMVGAITSRTGFFLSSFQKWREEILLREARTTVFADLGYGVLDTAMVETAAYCLARI
jgi:hypothetical protein